MTHNRLSRSLSRIPMWVVQIAVSAILTGGIAWCTWASVSSWKHEVRIGVVEAKVEDVHTDIQDLKLGQKETDQKIERGTRELNQKLDRLLERQQQPRIYGR
jgi:hypothetical protein